MASAKSEMSSPKRVMNGLGWNRSAQPTFFQPAPNRKASSTAETAGLYTFRGGAGNRPSDRGRHGGPGGTRRDGCRSRTDWNGRWKRVNGAQTYEHDQNQARPRRFPRCSRGDAATLFSTTQRRSWLRKTDRSSNS